MIEAHEKYGKDDCSYKAAGELSGLIKLVDCFYHYMDTLPDAQHIRSMHSDDLTITKQKLAYFLSGWMGGPKLYAEHFKAIPIPSAHKHLPIGVGESDAWLLCMQKAVDAQPYDPEFKMYLIAQLRVPAQRITEVCSHAAKYTKQPH